MNALNSGTVQAICGLLIVMLAGGAFFDGAFSGTSFSGTSISVSGCVEPSPVRQVTLRTASMPRTACAPRIASTPRTTSTTRTVFPPGIDLSGIDAFWEVADVLSDGRNPGSGAWDRLFDTPGYAMLADRYPLRYPIRMSIKLSFDPRREAERRNVEASTVWMRPRMIRHMKRVKAQRPELAAFRDTLVADDSLIADALEHLRPHLPPGALETRYPPLVSFVLFLDDGYASPDVVAIDLLMAKTLGRPALVRFIAHELFHAYRSALALPQDQRGVGYMSMLIGALEQLENEGIADRIDKPDLLASHPDRGSVLGDYADDYRTAYADAPTRVQQIGRLMARMESRRRFAPDLVRRIQRAIPMGGHPTGAYMADVIVEHSGEDALRATVGDVFRFLHAYQHAAAQDPRAPVFPDEAMYLVERLQTRTAHP